MVRGLALRSLCSLRLPGIIEYVMTPLRSSLADSSSYVRKTGVLGIAKVHRLSPEAISSTSFVDQLYNLLRDRDTGVVTNVIVALQEILRSEGGMAVNQPIIHHLLTRIKDFSEWGQCQVLDLVARYKPENDTELFGIMNLLDPCLKASNAAVVLATTKCFITFTQALPDIQQQVFMRLKTPLLTLVGTATQETGFVVLKHVESIVSRAPGVFNSEYKQFFCRYSEPTSAQSIKLRILPAVADTDNFGDIVSELSEYIGGVDSDVAAQAVVAVGNIALNVPAAVDTAIATLLEVLDLDMEADWVLSQTTMVMQSLLRRYPARASSVIPSLHKALRQVTDPDGRSAVVWMLGEYGEILDDAPYLLEELVEEVADGTVEVEVPVKLELLTSTLKLFFKRPPEVKPALGKLLSTVLEAEEEDAAVRDRALLYYRLLSTDRAAAASMVGASERKEPLGAFMPDLSPAVTAVIFSEFDSLSIMYDKPSSEFIGDKFRTPAASGGGGGGAATTAGAPAPQAGHAPPAGGLDDLDDLLGGGTAPPPAPTSSVDDLDDLLGGGGTPSAAAPASPAPTSADSWALQAGASMDPPTFKSKWSTLPDSAQATFGVAPPTPITMDSLREALVAANMAVVATGMAGTALKVFVAGVEAGGGAVHVAQVQIAAGTSADGIAITIKSEPGGDVPAFATALRASLLPLGLQ